MLASAHSGLRVFSTVSVHAITGLRAYSRLCGKIKNLRSHF